MKTRTPHNALFTSVFSKKEQAIAALRAILPPNLVSLIDWDSLVLANGSFIDAALSHRQSDLLYWAKLRNGEPIALYLLWEHQSSFDALLPYRVLRYEIRIVDQWLMSNKGAKRIPAVIPVVVSHVQGGWKGSESLMDILMLPREWQDVVRDYVPNFRFIHDDLMKVNDEELMGRSMHALGALALLLLKHGREKRSLVPLLKEWIELLREVWKAANREEAFATLMRYVLLTNAKTEVEDLRREVVPLLGEAADEVIMTELQRMMAQVRAETMTEAQRMVAQERAEAQRMVAQERAARERAEQEVRESRGRAVLAILRARGLAVSDEQREKIQSCSDVNTLDRWLERAAVVQSAEEVVDAFPTKASQ